MEASTFCPLIRIFACGRNPSDMLYGSPDALPLLVHDWEKRQLALGENGTRFEQRTLPLSAIYILEERLPDTAPSVNSTS